LECYLELNALEDLRGSLKEKTYLDLDIGDLVHFSNFRMSLFDLLLILTLSYYAFIRLTRLLS